MHGYQQITFGGGATLKTENIAQCKNFGTLVPMSSQPSGGNFWFDNDDFLKWCVEGAVSNLIGQLLSINDAAKFKKLAYATEKNSSLL